jgi:hypothetical protein
MENPKAPADPSPAGRPKKPYVAPAIIFTTQVEGRAVVCSKADGNCTLGPTSS